MVDSGAAAVITYSSCSTVKVFDSIFHQHQIPHVSVTRSSCNLMPSNTTMERTFTNRSLVLQLLFDVILREDWDFFYLLVDETTGEWKSDIDILILID